MTQVTYGELFLEARGHAGMARQGQDIVCAAVSVLCYTLAYELMALEDKGLKAEAEFSDGFCRLAASGPEKLCKEARRIFKYTLSGLRLLAKKYPENVRIEKASHL